MNTAIKQVAFSLDADGRFVLPGYEWISFQSLSSALKWRKRNYRLRTAYNLDA